MTNLSFLDKFHNLPWLKSNLSLLVLHGSKAYNTHIESSDDDYKGFCIPPRKYYLSSIHKFEQAESKDKKDGMPDAVIYEIRKFINLAVFCNPNIIEVLFVDPSDILYTNKVGEEVLANRDMFLSKKIRHTMSGYAHSQLHRLKLHRGYLLNPPKKIPERKDFGLSEKDLIPKNQLEAVLADIKKELDKFTFDFLDNLDESQKIALRNTVEQMMASLKLNEDTKFISAARAVGLDDNFIEKLQLERNFLSAKRDYDKYQEWKNNRNPVRALDEAKFGYDPKFAYHLIRLLRMCVEVLETGKVIVKRPDREDFLSIRRGEWSYDKLIEEADKLNIKSEELYKTSTVIPHSPDLEKVDEFCINLVTKYLWT